MLLRMLVSQYLRQAAEQKLQAELTRVAQRRGIRLGPQAEGEEGESPVEEEIPPCDVAITFALGVESGGLYDLLSEPVSTRCPTFLEHVADHEGRRMVIAETGVGCENAAQATADVIAIHRPAWIVSAGFAGGLCDEMLRGHILMADHVLDTRGNELSVGFQINPQVVEATKGLHVGRLLTVDQLIRTEREKRELGEQHHAVACDMETMAVAEACRQAKVRFLSVRIISDAVNDHLPKEIDKLMGQPSLAGKLGAAVGAIMNRPSSVQDMWKLKEEAMKASERLAKFLLGVVPQLVIDRTDDK